MPNTPREEEWEEGRDKMSTPLVSAKNAHTDSYIGSCKQCKKECYEDANQYSEDATPLFDTGLCKQCENNMLQK